LIYPKTFLFWLHPSKHLFLSFQFPCIHFYFKIKDKLRQNVRQILSSSNSFQFYFVFRFLGELPTCKIYILLMIMIEMRMGDISEIYDTIKFQFNKKCWFNWLEFQLNCG
jgi:hypothetical protein